MYVNAVIVLLETVQTGAVLEVEGGILKSAIGIAGTETISLPL